MKKTLEDLKIEVPSIDLLEARKLFGGSGNYGDPPGGSIPIQEEGEGYMGEPRPHNSNEDLYQRIEQENRDHWRDEMRSDYENDNRPEHGSGNGDGRPDYDPNEDRDNDQDRDQDNEENQYNEEIDRDNSPQYGGEPGGINNSNQGSFGHIGNPKDLSSFPEYGAPQTSQHCGIYSIFQVLKHFQVVNSHAVNADIVFDYVKSHTTFTQEQLDQGLRSGEDIIVLNSIFDTNQVFSNQQYINALDKNNPLVAGLTIQGYDGKEYNHIVVITEHDAKGNFRYYDPQLGVSTWTHQNTFHNGVRIDFATEIIDLNRDFMDDFERSNAGPEEEDTRNDLHGPF